MKIYEEDGQVCLFGPAGCAGKMFQARSAAEHRSTRTSASSWRKSFELKAVNYMFLDLSGPGNLLGSLYWEIRSPWLGGSSMLNTGPAPLNAVDVFSLSQILQDSPPRKYYLSRTACLGILRRARERGKELPPQLKAALMAQAGLAPLSVPPADPIAFAANQRDEVWNLNDAAGALNAQPSTEQQTYIASFSAGAGASAGSIGYSQKIAPTLKGTASGNCMPSVLCLNDQGGERMDVTLDQTATLRAQAGGHQPLICLNDQGGSVMEWSEDISGTLRAQEHGHQPLVFENHGQDTRFKGPVGVAQTVSASFGEGGNNQPLVIAAQEKYPEENMVPVVELYENYGIDARYTGPHPVSPTLSARAGTGGNNLPLALQVQAPIRISSGAIDRQPQNSGLGCPDGIACTVTATDHHTVYSRQRVDVFKDDEIASTESARQHKDATDLIYQETVGALTSRDRKDSKSQYTGQDKQIAEGPLLIRRLTPLECERLMGCPDGWTDIPGASDSARYRSLGNSVVISCVEYIMRGIAMAAGA